ncbi:hypothetical protein [Hymenobacter rubidus]|uniref:hypothetical protein n=1 Tax=Hymenobacter rubidus TaxID=1441626 RepID=UPI00192000B4|nr:hypothetical protein [Hymenobacter rubidus]
MPRPWRRLLAGAALLLLAAPRTAPAQPALVTVSAGYGTGAAKWGTFEQFLAGYLAANGSDVASAAEFGTVQPLSLRVCGLLGMVSFGYDQARANLRTTFKSGGERDFNIRQNQLTMALEPNYPGKHFFVGAIGGLGFGSLRVDCPLVYADGTVSYGAESQLTGVYRAISLTPFFGGKVGGSYKNAALTLRVQKFVAGNLTHDFTLDDQTEYHLPTDYALYLKQGAALYPSSAAVQGDVSTLRFQLELGYMFGVSKDE